MGQFTQPLLTGPFRAFGPSLKSVLEMEPVDPTDQSKVSIQHLSLLGGSDWLLKVLRFRVVNVTCAIESCFVSVITLAERAEDLHALVISLPCMH